MRLLLVSLNYSPELIGIGRYSGELARSLVARGHEVQVVCGPPFYPQWRIFDGYRNRYATDKDGGVLVRRVPVHLPRQITGRSRIAHYASFAASAFATMCRAARSLKPDWVMLVAPSLMAAPGALFAARLGGARSWLHVQDFEVEAGIATGQLGPAGPAAKAALAFERSCIRRFDRTSSISPEMCARLAERGSRAPLYELRNWADLDAIRPQEHSPYRERWRIGDRHVALYSGAMARKQGLGTLADTARLLRDRDDIAFVLCGDGPMREELESRAAGLPNVQLHDLQPAEALGDLLALASVHLLPQKAGAAGLMLPSKLTNMLASGKPVIAGAAPGTGLAAEVEGCGYAVAPEDPAAMAAALERLIDDSATREQLGAAARRRAERQWSRETIIDGLEGELAA